MSIKGFDLATEKKREKPETAAILENASSLLVLALRAQSIIFRFGFDKQTFFGFHSGENEVNKNLRVKIKKKIKQ